ncbi:manganese efflux pump [Clostridia bacterium OttesenSCG-928-F22]|nr:manganese efflux pump [Clostridia bacterium OttesenSCG-928-F22]
MQALSIILLGVATNLDNLLIGLAYGMNQKRISLPANLFIGILSGLITFVMCYAASFCMEWGRIPNYIGAGLIATLGIYTLIPRKEKQGKRYSEAKNITLEETCILGLALAVNCLAAAFGAGMTGLAAGPAGVIVGVFSMFAVGLGNYLGLFTATRINATYLNTASGIIMIVLGVIQAIF